MVDCVKFAWFGVQRSFLRSHYSSACAWLSLPHAPPPSLLCATSTAPAHTCHGQAGQATPLLRYRTNEFSPVLSSQLNWLQLFLSSICILNAGCYSLPVFSCCCFFFLSFFLLILRQRERMAKYKVDAISVIQ